MPSKKKNEQAKWAVIREWDDWAKLYPDDVKKSPPGLYFPLYLQTETQSFWIFSPAPWTSGTQSMGAYSASVA